MDKLQYDSFYKYLVSLGTILITAPLLVIYYILNLGNDLLFTSSEVEQLSPSSLNILQERETLISSILKFLPIITVILLIIGLICLVYGATKWHSLQKEIDEQTRLKTIEQRTNLKQQTPTDIVERIIDESNESTDESDSNKSISTRPKSRLVKLMEIENACYSYISEKHSKKFTFRQNIKIANHTYDMIAISKYNNIDYIYEFKYWSHLPANDLLTQAIKKLEESGIAYENSAHRNFKCKLFIVIPDEKFVVIKEHCLLKLRELNSSVISEFISESDLYK